MQLRKQKMNGPDSGIIAPRLPGAQAHCYVMEKLSPEALTQVASYFQALAEPTRLRILNLLRDQPRSVGELAEATSYSAANVSRHLALLAQRGLLAREAQGTSVYYRIADPSIYELCNLVCGNLGRRFEASAAQRADFAAAAQGPRVARVPGAAKAPKARRAPSSPSLPSSPGKPGTRGTVQPKRTGGATHR
jgi:DNA-binding transcriptional ArsR family regulator